MKKTKSTLSKTEAKALAAYLGERKKEAEAVKLAPTPADGSKEPEPLRQLVPEVTEVWRVLTKQEAKQLIALDTSGHTIVRAEFDGVGWHTNIASRKLAEQLAERLNAVAVLEEAALDACYGNHLTHKP